jgi:hypothetical protein
LPLLGTWSAHASRVGFCARCGQRLCARGFHRWSRRWRGWYLGRWPGRAHHWIRQAAGFFRHTAGGAGSALLHFVGCLWAAGRRPHDRSGCRWCVRGRCLHEGFIWRGSGVSRREQGSWGWWCNIWFFYQGRSFLGESWRRSWHGGRAQPTCCSQTSKEKGC